MLVISAEKIHIAGEILGLAALIFFGGIGLFFLIKGLCYVVRIPGPPTEPYSYKKEELWEPPPYWKNWQKNT